MHLHACAILEFLSVIILIFVFFGLVICIISMFFWFSQVSLRCMFHIVRFMSLSRLLHAFLDCVEYMKKLCGLDALIMHTIAIKVKYCLRSIGRQVGENVSRKAEWKESCMAY